VLRFGDLVLTPVEARFEGLFLGLLAHLNASESLEKHQKLIPFRMLAFLANLRLY
jgi:hypothetical protein